VIGKLDLLSKEIPNFIHALAPIVNKFFRQKNLRKMDSSNASFVENGTALTARKSIKG
jgi:hypothetical protein